MLTGFPLGPCLSLQPHQLLPPGMGPPCVQVYPQPSASLLHRLEVQSVPAKTHRKKFLQLFQDSGSHLHLGENPAETALVLSK